MQINATYSNHNEEVNMAEVFNRGLTMARRGSERGLDSLQAEEFFGAGGLLDFSTHPLPTGGHSICGLS